MSRFTESITRRLQEAGISDAGSASAKQWYEAVSLAAMEELRGRWQEKPGQKRACYRSAEFLVGRLINNNLMSLGPVSYTHLHRIADFLIRVCKETLIDPALFGGKAQDFPVVEGDIQLPRQHSSDASAAASIPCLLYTSRCV